MKIKDLTASDLETLTYDDLAYMILDEAGKKSKISDLFQKVCKIMNLSATEYEERIGDFFELLSTDKRFIMLENGYWDLRDKHSHKIVIDEEEEDEVILEDQEEDILEEEEKDDFYDESTEDDDDTDDGLEDLVVISDDEEETNGLD